MEYEEYHRFVGATNQELRPPRKIVEESTTVGEWRLQLIHRNIERRPKFNYIRRQGELNPTDISMLQMTKCEQTQFDSHA